MFNWLKNPSRSKLDRIAQILYFEGFENGLDKRYTRGNMHIDHIKSIQQCVQEGVNPNTDSNYQLLCPECNQSKGG